MSKVYQIVTDRIIQRMQTGVVPWRRPWVRNGAVSWDRQRPYRGINALLLEPGEYATYKAIQEAGGQIKKSEKSTPVVFWKWLEKGDPDTGEVERIPYLRYYSVFEINTQAEGLKSHRPEEVSFEHSPIIEAEKIRNGYANCPPIQFNPSRACYKPREDLISIPEIADFPHPDEYYNTLFHEMTHSTGHPSRLARKGIDEIAAFGSDPYAREELVAEIGAAMLSGVAGISNDRNQDNSAAYLNNWIRRLKEDPRMIVQTAAQAQKAADYIQGITYAG